MSAARDCALASLDDGVSGVGAQLVVRRGRTTVCDIAIGRALPGRAMTAETVQFLYCLTKPVVAMAVVATAQTCGFGLDDDIAMHSARVERMCGGRRISLRNVLSHAAGLHPIVGAEVMFRPRAGREHASDELVFAPDWNIGVDHSYSEFQGWNLLRVWLEEVTGQPFGAAVRSALLDPLGIRDIYFGMSDIEWENVYPRIGVHHELDSGFPLPLLHELLRKHVDDPEFQALGGCGTATAIADFYRAVLDALAGHDVPGLPTPELVREMVTPTAPPAADALLTSAMSFGLGFMTDLPSAFGPAIGPRAFGHIGPLGAAFAFADPDLDLVVAYVSNGFAYRDGEIATVRGAREALVDAIYSDVGVRA